MCRRAGCLPTLKSPTSQRWDHGTPQGSATGSFHCNAQPSLTWEDSSIWHWQQRVGACLIGDRCKAAAGCVALPLDDVRSSELAFRSLELE